MANTPPTPAPTRSVAKVAVPLVIGAIVAVGVGVYGRVHTPTGAAVNLPGFSSVITAKTWVASAAALLGLVQLGSALVMWGKIPRITAPGWIGRLHRWSGRVAFLLVVAVAMQCLYALGFQTYSTRVLLHSLLGCFFFGVFTAKMLVLTKKGLPGWILPVLGGLLFTVLIAIWLSSALWFFTTIGFEF